MKKLGIGCGVVVLIAIAIVIGVCAMAGNEVTKDRDVRYEVTGSAQSVDVTYTNESGGTSQIGTTAVPWSTSFTAEGLSMLSITAQNQTDSGTVTVTIYVDGKAEETSTSDGAYVVASASHIV